MLIKSLKFTMWAVYTIFRWTLVPLFAFFIRHSQWKDRPFDFAAIFLNDPQVVKVATDAGQAALLVQLRGTIEAMAQSKRDSMVKVHITPQRQAENEAYAREHPEEFARFEAAMRAEMDRVGIQIPVTHHPLCQEACNEFLESLHGATITRAEMMTIEGESEDDHQEHVEIITNAGMFCIVAPDIGFSYTKQTERPATLQDVTRPIEPMIPAGAPIRINITPEMIARNEAYAREHPEEFARFEKAMRSHLEGQGIKLPEGPC